MGRVDLQRGGWEIGEEERRKGCRGDAMQETGRNTQKRSVVVCMQPTH